VTGANSKGQGAREITSKERFQSLAAMPRERAASVGVDKNGKRKRTDIGKKKKIRNSDVSRKKGGKRRYLLPLDEYHALFRGGKPEWGNTGKRSPKTTKKRIDPALHLSEQRGAGEQKKNTGEKEEVEHPRRGMVRKEPFKGKIVRITGSWFWERPEEE